MNRRDFLQTAALAGAGLFSGRALPPLWAEGPGSVRFAQIADVHMVGFSPEQEGVCPSLSESTWLARGRRYELMGYLLPCALRQLQDDLKPDCVVFTGDDADNGNGAKGEADLRQFKGIVERNCPLPAHYAYGNHDGPQARWSEIFGPLSHTFDTGGVRFVVLNSGGMNPDAEQESSLAALQELQRAIASAEGRRLVVLLHQYIYPEAPRGYAIARAGEMRQALEAYPHAVAVINGHQHAGGYNEVQGIHYCTARAFCEPPFCMYLYELTAGALTWTEYTFSPSAKGFVAGKPRELKLRDA